MPAHSEQQFSPYNTQQLFDLVADVERYPEFLPWCRAARVVERGQGYLLGELVISFSHMVERYTSRVALVPPTGPNEGGSIDVEMVSGPFQYLTNQWVFTPRAGGGTQIDFALDFKFRSKILERLIGGMFAKATAKMATAFKERADALYGARKS